LTRGSLALLFLSLVIVGSFIDKTAAEQRLDSTEMIILYAHTDNTVGVQGGKILSTAPPYGQRRSTILDKEISFILYPSLVQELSIEGSVNYRLYLRSPVKRVVQLNVSLCEVNVEGGSTRVSSAVVALPVDNQINQYVLGIPIIHTFGEGSTIIFSMIPRSDVSSLVIFWDEEGTATYVALPIKRAFNVLDLQTTDPYDEPIVGANVTISIGGNRIWTGRTDSEGWARALLPKSRETLHEVIVIWKEAVVNRTIHYTTEDATIRLKCKVYSLDVSTRDLLGFPVEGATVTLSKGGSIVGGGRTSGEGKVRFSQLPESEYSVEVKYNFTVLALTLPTSEKITLHLSSDVSREIEQRVIKPWILNSALGIFLILMASGSTITLVKRRRRGVHEYDFNYFDTLTGGGIPPSSSVMIMGPAGSGKTVLAKHLLMKALRSGDPCVFITNLDFPSNIRRELKVFEPNLEEYEKTSRLIFIDCYSASGGRESPEEHRTPAVGDLTGLGVQVSACLEKLGQNTDVFLDSLTPLFTMLRDEYIANFVHSVGAKTKGVNGRFFYTLGTGIGREGLNTIEAASDCVIEISSTEEAGECKRRLRIKKLKKRHIERWTEFSVDGDRGIIFRTTKSRDVQEA